MLPLVMTKGKNGVEGAEVGSKISLGSQHKFREDFAPIAVHFSSPLWVLIGVIAKFHA